MKDGNMNAILKRGDEKWEFILEYCVQCGVIFSADQCLFRWDQILALFKKLLEFVSKLMRRDEASLKLFEGFVFSNA
ncbi:hypothetical protein GOP47_0017323 [Adiantum capillus-veneris]|uniref:Uncharacterized protein n=1 Tax=Adiantum capillus-veneris TaxID=13818 RepID=A0A9D4UFD3_ADICA|nr:hypothetical protein GOP47_0017323 [Adiantum capillus-veneris]